MRQYEERDRLNNEYFEWMYKLVCNDRYSKRQSYRKLLYFLHNTPFKWELDMDGNRAIDGVDFRYRFGYAEGYSRNDISKYLDTRPCTVLELIMALAISIEEDIMDDPRYGNRTGQWFWNMIVSLGLGNMSDDRFDRGTVERIIFRFLDRRYESDGAGGLFTVPNPPQDMRNAEIWHQAMWYLDEFLKNE